MTRFALILCALLAGLPVRAASSPSAPRRIVSLAPATTEIVYALGLGKFVVGDTVYCDYPPAARSVAKIGDVNTSYEKVLALRPDLVVASDANRAAAARLTQLGVPVFTLTLTSWRSAERSVDALGRLTGTQAAAARLVRQMEAARKEAAALARRDTRPPPRVLFVLSASPLWVAGGGTFVNDLLVMAGAVNCAGAVHGYAPYSPEALLSRPPDVVVADPQTQTQLRRSPALSTLSAVRQGRFVFPSDPNILLRPGPRLGTGLLWLARALHPGTK